MKLIVGLGNPGRIYTDSRHNIGFQVIRLLARAAKITLKKDSGAFCLSAKSKIGAQQVILAIPLTFMNLSGSSVSALMEKYKIGLEDLLVVCDDLDLELGRIKIRPRGSSAGHRGIASVIDSLGTEGFPRLRIGIGRPHKDKAASAYVLSRFTKKEKTQLKQILDSAADCCRMWLSEGVAKTMSIFNRRSS